MGLYGEKEQEYRSGKVMPFLSEELFNAISKFIGNRQVWEITDADLKTIETMMIEMTAKANKV